MLSEKYETLITSLQKLPGIGEKSANRLALYLLEMPKNEARSIGLAIIEAADSFHNCPICNMLTDEIPCPLCQNENRDDKLLCIVENTQDVLHLEKTNEFHGRYFVLGNLLSPMNGIGPEEIKFPLLQNYLSEHKVDEIILALSPSVEGETTMNFLLNQLQNQNLNITRLSMGLPFGGDMEYATAKTLTTALKRRYKASE